jgi:F0F1-type ATP synthase assembly protein I
MPETPPAAPPPQPTGDPPPKPDGTPSDADEEQRRLGIAAAGSGLQFAASVIVFVYLGQWLDRKLGTDPLFLLVGLVLGAGGSFYSLYRRLMAAQSPPKPRDPPSP